MQINRFLGRARLQGNTATAWGWVAAEIEKAGHSVDRTHRHTKTIGACLGCRKGRATPNPMGGARKDDPIADRIDG